MVTSELTDELDFDALRELVKQGRPEKTKGTITKWANEVWDFKYTIKIGDFIVMPSKQEPKFVAIGTMAGEYEYNPEALSGYAHGRKVEWVNKRVLRAKVSDSLKHTFRKQMTVHDVSDHTSEVAALIGVVAPPPTDPWSQSNITTLAQELLWQPNHLQEIIQDLQEKHQVIFYGPRVPERPM